MPEAYTERSRGVTEKRAELLSEGLFNTLLLSICGAFECEKSQHRRDKHKSLETPTETPPNTPGGAPNLNTCALTPVIFSKRLEKRS